MRRLNVSVLILMVLFCWSWGQTAPEFGQVWHKSDLNPVLVNESIPGSWNSGGYGSHGVGHTMWDGENYRLYLSSETDSASYYTIGLFISPHLDSGWVAYENNPVFIPDSTNWDVRAVMTPHVIKDGDTFKMWYAGRNEAADLHIGYAESDDGITWIRHLTPVLSPMLVGGLESENLTSPSVVKNNDTSYTMWYDAYGTDGWEIFYAQSVDGINWTRPPENLIISQGTGWTSGWIRFPLVQRTDDHYTMWFTASSNSYMIVPARIGTAISTDGIHWKRDHLFNPVLSTGDAGDWDDTFVIPSGVFMEENESKLLYLATDRIADYISVGVATYAPTIVPAGDVSGTWTKAGSPIRVQGEITIPNGETLTIEPGTTVEFLGHDPLNVQGQILAVGTAEEPIRFMVDDTLGFYNIADSDGVWGGIRFDGTSATNDSSFLKYCEIEYAKTFAGNAGTLLGEHGGGILIKGFSKVQVEQCLIQHNLAVGNVVGTSPIGGGIAITDYANPAIINNLIQHNKCVNLIDFNGGSGGGIMVARYSDPLISGNTIRYNRSATTGGGLGVWLNSEALVINNLIIENVSMHNDGTDGAGGGVSLGMDARPIFINNTIVNNTASWSGGVFSNGGNAVFINTIIANNRATVEPYEGHDIGTWGMSGHTLDFQNSCLEGGVANIFWGSSVGNVNFVESLSIDPYLRHDYTLNPYFSQCFGAGTSSCEIDGDTYYAPSTDINGDPRPNPAGSSPDMGAFESPRSGHHITGGWNWWHWAESPVLMPGPNGTWDDNSVHAPDVLFYEGQYHMWYAGGDGNRSHIGHATSDDGLDWDRDPANPVLTSESTGWQGNSLNVPRVVLVGDTLHMWFWTDSRAGHATSTNGRTWTFTPDPVLEGTSLTWDEETVVISDVIYRDSLFHAWYTGLNNDTYAIGYATSADGIEWEKHPDPVFESSASGWDSRMYYASSVVWDGDYFQMWYCAKENTDPSRIGRAYSTDGINWTRVSTAAPEIDYGEAGSWNAAASFYPAVLLDQGRYKVWFNGVPTIYSSFRIGYATLEPVAADQSYVEMPQSFMLSQNYPNPFNPMTHIRYSLPENGDIRLVIYDLLGREIVELVNDYRSVGNYETTWYGIDRNGNQVSTGVYFARLEAGRNVDVIKMLYLK